MPLRINAFRLSRHAVAAIQKGNELRKKPPAMLMQNNTAARHTYRADIDGLRAIAVVAVLIFHSFPHALHGGFLGVDVFFVISGFLITGIISGGIDQGTFSLLSFYQRRIRRIYPTLILVLTATLLVGFFILPPTPMHRLGWHIMGAALFIPNLLLWNESGYFDAESLTKPLLHLWSLGVEEQFYILWPVLILLVKRTPIRLAHGLAAVVALSLAYNIYLSFTLPAAAFYSPLSRAWELAVGGLISCFPIGFRTRNANTLASGFGVILIAAAMVFASHSISSPIYMVAAVAGAGLLITSGPNSDIAQRFLACRPMVAIGLISYPLYLWHWPILVLARGDAPFSNNWTLALVGVSGVLATVTYTLVEHPLRQIPLEKVVVPLFIALVALGGFGAAASHFDFQSLTYPQKMRDILAYGHYDFRSNARIGTCWLYKPLYMPDQRYHPECDFASGSSSPKIAVWGDSHAGRLFPGLSLAAEGKASVAIFAADSCPPINNFGACSKFTDDALSAIIRNKPDIVVLFARWSFYSADYATGAVGDGLKFYLDALQNAGISVAIVGPFPEYSGQLPDLIFNQWLSNKSRGIPNRINDLPRADSAAAERSLQALAEARNIPYLSLIDIFCRDNSCATSWSDNPSDLLTWDYGHLTTGAGQFVGRKLLKILIDRPKT
ncbi:acyltransferase [Sinorhizobium sp. B11]